MYNVEIRRPRVEDTEELHQFFRTVIQDTFFREGIADLLDDIENEFKTKKHYLKTDLESNGQQRYFLIAVDKNNKNIIGTIEYGPASELIRVCTDGALSHLHEVGTVFVHPDYQKRGIGTLLVNVIVLTLQNRGIQEFCLDSGYAQAQKVWSKKFGEPDYLLKDYWGEGADHMIWRPRTNDVPLLF
ncbi:GNAT family N-acetyltransferase [Brevibacillus ruminantium]|uniref:GNAT family N-acetyltransferase n=1 Tax=Brevibacillus ruminantium TaxID=2950604 RepID=A0ABY4WF37_9BACL|nr:GNAT family N-acetyltransferase [Brevibacillus ruminantium]USG65461.1 GNAT family N-acetyltransferase [Brevibacillus ruminantium]